MDDSGLKGDSWRNSETEPKHRPAGVKQMSAHRFSELKAKFVAVCQRFKKAKTIEEKWSLLRESDAILAEARSLMVGMRETNLKWKPTARR